MYEPCILATESRCDMIVVFSKSHFREVLYVTVSATMVIRTGRTLIIESLHGRDPVVENIATSLEG